MLSIIRQVTRYISNEVKGHFVAPYFRIYNRIKPGPLGWGWVKVSDLLEILKEDSSVLLKEIAWQLYERGDFPLWDGEGEVLELEEFQDLEKIFKSLFKSFRDMYVPAGFALGIAGHPYWGCPDCEEEEEVEDE